MTAQSWVALLQHNRNLSIKEELGPVAVTTIAWNSDWFPGKSVTVVDTLIG